MTAPPLSSETAPPKPAHARPTPWSRLPRPELRWPSTHALVNACVVLAATIFILKQLHPELLLRNTTTAGGDMGAHVWMPAYMRDHLLPHFRLTGWTPDWYAGYPVLVFYFPLPTLLIVMLDVVLPYSIAFKLVTVLGMLTLPVCAFIFGRLSGLKDPAPACLSAATLPFLFDRTFTIYGGNIPSTLAGEFAFSISLSVMLLFFGVVARGLETGRYRALAAGLLAITGLCHMIPAIFAVIGGIVLVLFRIDKQRLKWAFPVFAVGGALATWWAFPFLIRLPYTTDMGWEKITEYQKSLFPSSFVWVVTLAVVGAFISILQRRRTGLFLAAMAIITGLMFKYFPQGRLWNARLLPFWFLWLWLLAGITISEMGSFVAASFRGQGGIVGAEPAGGRVDTAEAGTNGDGLGRYAVDGNGSGGGFGNGSDGHEHGHEDESPEPQPERRFSGEKLARFAELATPVIAVLAALAFVGFPLRVLPGGKLNSAGQYTWMGFSSSDRSFIPDWVRWNYSGYEDPGKPRRLEYQDLIKVMSGVGKDNGCGRAMWEYESEEDGFGTPMALMLLPHWTDGCIGSMEGLFFESSGTTPYHFLNQAELSERPSKAMRDIPYRNLDVKSGVEHLQLLGVRYYMALTPSAQADADQNPDLELVTTSGPWTVHYANGDQQRTWKIYQVRDSDIVEPLAFEPAVMTNVDKGAKGWLAASAAWYNRPDNLDVPLAASGPEEWPRYKAPLDPLSSSEQSGVVGFETLPPREPVDDPAIVSNIKTSDDRISFDVDRVGKPVLVKTSYFPNWKASGAGKIYRVSPNQMVVVPTSNHVSLHYSHTPIDMIGWFVTLLGAAGVVVLLRMAPVKFPARRSRRSRRSGGADGPAGGSGDGDGYSTALEKQLTRVGPGQNPDVDVDAYFD